MYDFFTRNKAEKMFTFLTNSKKFAKTSAFIRKFPNFYDFLGFEYKQIVSLFCNKIV